MSSGKSQGSGKDSDHSKGRMLDKKQRKSASGKSQSKKEGGSKRKTTLDRDLPSSAVSVSSNSSSTTASNQPNKRMRGLELSNEDKFPKADSSLSQASKSTPHDFLEFIDRVRNGCKDISKVSGKEKLQPKVEAVDAVSLAKNKVAEEQKKLQQRNKAELGDATDPDDLAAAVAANAQDPKLSTMTSQNRDIRELQLLNELRQQVLSQSASDEATALLLKKNHLNNLLSGGMGNPNQADLASAAAASELRELQLQQELRQQLLMQTQASQLQASDLLQSNYMQNYSALSLLQQQQQQQQQKDIADYLQLLNGGSSLSAAAASPSPAAMAGLAGLSPQEVDNALLRASLAQNSVAPNADTELLLRLQNMKANSGIGAAEQLQLLSSSAGLKPSAGGHASGLNTAENATADELASSVRNDPYGSALSQYYASGALSRMGESLPLSSAPNGLSSLAPSSALMSSLGSGAGQGIPPSLLLNPEVRAALMQEGGLSPQLLQNLGAHGM